MQFDATRNDLTVGVIGAGAMGRGIAQVAAAGSMQVLITDSRAGAAQEAANSSTSCSRAPRKRAA